MARKVNRRLADIPAGQADPLSYAVTSRDRSVLEMVEQAVKHRQVMLAYQVVVPARAQNQAAFYEGLIRVLDDTGRIIPARNFIREIENTETGRIIDCLALEKGIFALAKYPELRLSINMSAHSIGYSRWQRVLKRGLSADPTVAERLILEISEGSAMQVPELVTSFMNELQSKGISFALDDFGAGFTSFKHLRDFYFDMLKIDGQFIRGITKNPDNQVLTAAMIAVAEQFDILTVAENVENAQEAAFLTELGVDCLQGYNYGAPTVKPPWLEIKQKRKTA